MTNFDFVENEKLRNQLDFIIECDKAKNVFRRTALTDCSRRENDAEHSWHLAVCAMTLFEYAPAGADLGRTVQMVTVHDLVEIYAGDTFAYDEQGKATKAERENEAADRLFGMLGEQGEYFRAMWNEFEECATPTALYARALDCLQPLLHNYKTEGYTWRGNHITTQMVLNRNAACREAMPEVWKIVEKIVEDSHEKGLLE
ncbi:MAG: HD domain-containing protein [Clostridia bacterium]|nr:HD domain-containing protein [Clostridia bacterium]